MKFARHSMYRSIPLRDVEGVPFQYALSIPALEMRRRIDRNAGGNIQGSDQVTNPATRGSDLFRSVHTPPIAAELEARVQTMCDFANGNSNTEFTPPAVRTILVHFWLAYDHPVVDGNGRIARALFYWSTAREGYWLSEYVSISRI